MNQRIALMETLTIDGGQKKVNPLPVIRYQYSNHLGSASLELDESGMIISYEEYHPFGTTSYRSGRNEAEVSLKRYKYNGKEKDEETGLYYYGARYYAPWLCRFISVDPLQYKYPHYSPYLYAGNNPVTNIDLNGEEEKSPQKNTESGFSIPSIPKYDYTGSWTDYIKAVDNAVINIVNLIPTAINSIVGSAESLINGTAGQDIANEFSGIKESIKDAVISQYNYAVDTPLKQQLVDTGKGLVSPEMFEFVLPFIAGGAISAGSKTASTSSVTSTRPSGTTGTSVTKVGAEKSIVIGEGMDAIKATAKELQSQGINAKWYQAWSKNFPKDRLMTPSEFNAALSRNERWLNTKIKQGYKIYDIGIDPMRTTRSPFYMLEKNILEKKNYPINSIHR